MLSANGLNRSVCLLKHKFNRIVATLLVVTGLATAVAPTSAMGQRRVVEDYCAVHFQARANWMRGLGGPPETIALWEKYAEIRWITTPRDWGMRSVLGGRRLSRKYEPEVEAVMDVMIGWANDGYGAWNPPLCMEDAFCSACTSSLRRRLSR